MVSLSSWRGRSNGTRNLEKKLSALQDDLGRLQRDLKGLAAAGGEIAGEQVSDVLETAGESARAAADRTARQLQTWTDGNLAPVRDRVRSQPLASLLLSIGAGALVGAILMAPRSPED